MLEDPQCPACGKPICFACRAGTHALVLRSMIALVDKRLPDADAVPILVPEPAAQYAAIASIAVTLLEALDRGHGGVCAKHAIPAIVETPANTEGHS